MKRRLTLLCLLLIVSCSNQPPVEELPTVTQQCPEFSAKHWLPLDKLQINPQQLINQQTFALHPNQATYWFKDPKAQQIGLCILPLHNSRRSSNDCGTIYVTYHKKDQTWQLAEQQMRICPG